MKLRDEITYDNVVTYAKSYGYQCAEKHSDWNGYVVYKAVKEEMNHSESGASQFILVKDNEIRMATSEELLSLNTIVQ